MATNTYNFPLNLTAATYNMLIEYIVDALSADTYAKIVSFDLQGNGNILIGTVPAFTDDEYTALSALVSAFTGEYVRHKYQNQVFAKVEATDREFRTLFSWVFNGTDLEPDFKGISVQSYMSGGDNDCDYTIRIVDTTNVTVLHTVTLTNMVQQRNQIIISNLPAKKTDLEMQIKKGPNCVKVVISALQFIYAA